MQTCCAVQHPQFTLNSTSPYLWWFVYVEFFAYRNQLKKIDNANIVSLVLLYTIIDSYFFSPAKLWMCVYAGVCVYVCDNKTEHLWQVSRFIFLSTVQLNVYALWDSECSHTISLLFKCSFVLCLYEQIVSAIGTIIDRQFDSHCVYARKISCLDKCFAMQTARTHMQPMYGWWIGARCFSSVKRFHWMSQMANDTYDDRETKKSQ